MAMRIGAPLRGHHLFRQAHVAANIDRYVALGLSLTPRTWNLDVPFSFFDFPAYQLLVAELCRHFALPTLPVARAVSVLLFALILGVYAVLLRHTCTPEMPRALTLVLFAYAPLNLFFLSAPLPDGLALLAAAVSLWGFVRWEDERRLEAWAVMVSAGLLSSLIKNPIYLPVLLAILWRRFRARGGRGLLEPDVVLLVAGVGAAVLWFKLLSNAVNGQSAFLSEWEGEHYFGVLADRFRLAGWGPILVGLGTLTFNPLTLGLALAGACLLLRRTEPGQELYVGLLLGNGATLLIFFNRCRVHSYYLLPCVFPLAFASAHALWRAAEWWKEKRGRWRWVLPAAVMGVTLVSTWAGLATMSEGPPWLESRGQWIQGLTDPNDFIVYVVAPGQGNWNPEYLYFAQREGYNLGQDRLTPDALAAVYVRFAASYRRLLIFCVDDSSNEKLKSLGAPVVATDRRRRLYRLEPRWIWPHAAGESAMSAGAAHQHTESPALRVHPPQRDPPSASGQSSEAQARYEPAPFAITRNWLRESLMQPF
jgi:hypothetical protein